MSDTLNTNFALRNGGYSNYEGALNLARHRWYYYKEGFSPFLVEKAIESSGIGKNDLIIDPFNGSGTTSLTASMNGFKSLGIEVNPFTAFLSSVKNQNASLNQIKRSKDTIIDGIVSGYNSKLLGFSTFSKTETNKKWLFNDSILSSFEGGWQAVKKNRNPSIQKIMQLTLLSSAMQNCNARKDGKCLRYKTKWDQKDFNTESFITSFNEQINRIEEDIEVKRIQNKPTIINDDCRKVLNKSKSFDSFKLCVTSPPYLNTFDYTDIYRPELFLGKFVNSQRELYDLRLRTVRSHIQAKWELPIKKDFGLVYNESINFLNSNKHSLMHSSIPLMVQAYFEDMYNILCLLRNRADKDAQIWLIVSNSAYANKEIPVDLIIGEIGGLAGWHLKEIGVLREIQRRKTKHSPDISHLRESVIIFDANRGRGRQVISATKL